MMTTTLSLYDALGEDQLQGINGGRGKCSANEALNFQVKCNDDNEFLIVV